MASSITNKKSRYTYGGRTDQIGGRLGWWERTIIPHQPDDILFEITSPYVGRPDLIAKDVYGTVEWLWMVLQYNTILDLSELSVGKIIHLPAGSRLM